MEIRLLGNGDEHALVELFEAVLPGFVEQLTDDHGPERFLSDPSTFAFGAWTDGVPAGLAWGVQMRAPSGRRISYLHELDVHASFRRRGIATRLVTESMALARTRGSSRFWLSTGGHNVVAQSLYESLGGDRKPLGDVNYWWELEPQTEP